MISLLQSFATIPLLAVVAFAILILIARPDRDDGRDGLYAVYLSTVSISALYVVLVFGATAINSAAQNVLVDFPRVNAQGLEGYDYNGFTSLFGGFDPSGGSNAAIRTAVATGLLAVGALIVLGFHLRRRSELVADADFEGSAAERVDRAFLGGVCFVAAIVGISAFGLAGYGLFRILAPDIAGDSESLQQELGSAEAIAYGLLTLVCAGIFRLSFWSIRDRDPEPGEVWPDEPVELSGPEA